MQNKLAVRKIVTFILSFLMIFNLIPSITNVNYNKEVIAVEENKIEEAKKQDKDKLKKKIENKKVENENKKSESSNENNLNDEGKKIQQEGKLKKLKKLALKSEKSEKDLKDIGKNDKVVKKEKVNIESLKKDNQILSEIKGAIPSENDPKDKTEHTELKNVKLLTLKGQEIDLLNGIRITDSFKFGFDWDSSYYENTLKEGDYFTVKLPDSFKFSEEAVTITIPLKTNDNNHVIANATITSNGKVGGGNIKAVFTNYVNDKYHIKGKVFLEAYFVKDKVIENQINNIEIWTGLTLQIMVLPPNPGPGPNPIVDEIIHKWTTKLLDNTKARWNLRINHKKGNFQNVVIRDSLTYEGNPNNPSFQGKYIPSSFRLTRVFLDEFGQTTQPAQPVPQNELDAKLTFNPEFTSFELQLGDLNGEQYRLTYESTYDEGLKVKNRAAFIANQIEQAFKEITYIYNNAGGEGDGDLLGKIKIIKVSAEDANLKLKGAKFRITRKATGETFELVTGNNGEVVSGLLVPGEYDIQEIEPPVGFLPNDQVYTVNVQQDQPSINTIRNIPEKTTVKVTKQWIGPQKEATVKLLKTVNGVVSEVETKLLTAVTGWEHIFTNLPKYENGVEIEYSVDEEDIPNYEKEIKKNGENDYIIINKNVEKVDVYVRKEWTGPTKEITVKLFKTVGGDTTEVETKVLNETTGWEHTFTNLPKYENGIEIEYTVDEQDIVGYEKEIVKFNNTYHVIRNKNVEKVDVKVTKQWIGPAVSEITVNLLANGVNLQSQILNQGNGWSHTFADLPKYEGVNEIVYTIEEVKVNGYESQIIKNGENNYTIVNRNNEKTEVKVEKQWIGPVGPEITVNLLANGKLKDSIKLNEGNGWSHTFKNLNVYQDGVDVVYTIEEVKVDGYESKIIKNNENSYVIVNVNKTTIEIPVTKEWVGESISEITVNLLANGKLKESVKLNEGNNWKHIFKDLPKYDEISGEEIIYTVSENALESYETVITGSMENGFKIVNTKFGKISIKVTKEWIGKKANSITVNLLADGVKVQSQNLSNDNGWQYVFSDLEKYKDGNEIIYTVEEEKIEGYHSKIKGNADIGFTIVNIEKPDKPEKPGEEDPKKPKKTNKPGNESKKHNPKTQDMNNINQIILVGTSVTLIILTAVVLKEINKKKHSEE